MPVIKSGYAETVLKDAIVLDLGDIARQGELMRQAAEAKARQIIEAADTEAKRRGLDASEKGHAKGYAEGLEKGLADGRERGHAEALSDASERLATIQQAWIDAAATWDSEREGMHRSARRAVLELALELARKVVHRVVETDEQIVADQLDHALAYVLHPVDVTVRICPDDRPVLEEAMPDLTARVLNVKHLHLVDDDQIGRGGCVLSYGQGQIDATIETQLRRLVELMLPTQEAIEPRGEEKLEAAPDDDKSLTDNNDDG